MKFIVALSLWLGMSFVQQRYAAQRVAKRKTKPGELICLLKDDFFLRKWEVKKLLKWRIDPYQEVTGQTAISLAQRNLDQIEKKTRVKIEKRDISGEVLMSYKWCIKESLKIVAVLKKTRPQLAGKMYLALTQGPWKFPKDIAKIIVKLRYDYKEKEKVYENQSSCSDISVARDVIGGNGIVKADENNRE